MALRFTYGDENLEVNSVLSPDFRSYLMVELPCFVRTITSAVSMMGLPSQNIANPTGDNGSSISSLVCNSKILQYRFPNPTDPYRHELTTDPLHQGPRIKNGLLIRLRRNKKTGAVTNEVVGGISGAFVFDQPADFHVSSRYNYYHLVNELKRSLVVSAQ
jgi:hypothetical protein